MSSDSSDYVLGMTERLPGCFVHIFVIPGATLEVIPIASLSFRPEGGI